MHPAEAWTMLARLQLNGPNFRIQMIKTYLVKATNGCGDHIAAVINAESACQAHELAKTLENWPNNHWDITVNPLKPKTNPPWLVDFEEFWHEDCHYQPKY